MKKYYIYIAAIAFFILYFFGSKLKELLSPVFGALLLTYIAYPFVNSLSKKLPKSVAAVLFYLLIFALLAVLIAVILPTVLSGIKELISYIPALSEKYPFIQADNILSFLSGKEKSISQFLSNIVSFIGKSVAAVVLSCFFLMDPDSLKEGFISLIPSSKLPYIIPPLREIDLVFKNFFRGQLLVSLILTAATFIALYFLKIKYALILSVIYGIFCLIPTAGPFIGAVPIVAAAYLKSPVSALIVLGIMILTQMLDNSFLSPKIKAVSVDISPAAAFISLYIGAGLFGLAGIILGVPVYASLKIIIRRILSAIS